MNFYFLFLLRRELLLIFYYKLLGTQNGGVRERRVGVGSVKSLDLEEWEVKGIKRMCNTAVRIKNCK